MFRLLFVDDQPRELEGMTRMMNWAELDLSVAGAVTDARSALALVEKEPVDVVITDVIMQDMDGLTLVRELKERHPNIRTICISGFDDFKFVSMAINNGASGYVLKPILVNEMRQVLLRVLEDLRKQRARGPEGPDASKLAMMCMNAAGWEQLFEGMLDTPVRVARGSGEPPEGALCSLRLQDGSCVCLLPEGLQAPQGAPVSPVMPLRRGYEAYLSTFPAREGASGAPSRDDVVVRIKQNVENHLSGEVTAEGLMEGVYLSGSYASALFKEATGMTVHRYAVRRRLEEAARLLTEEPGLRVKDIAWRCGFADASHLINSFQKTYGMTPEAYRRRRAQSEKKG